MRALALLLLVPVVVLADVRLRQGGVYVGPVTDLDCGADGGLLCSRDGGTSIGKLTCNAASATEPGCVTPNSQTYAGDKTFTGDTRLVGHVHASLTACDANHKGTWQTCTTHSAPVFCNGTSNIELLGSQSYETFPPIYVNGLLHSGLFYLSTWNLPYAYTVTTVSGLIAPGAGTTQTLRFSDSTNNCDCPITCATGATSLTCSGNCSFAANTPVVPYITGDGCTTPTTAKGLLVPAGYRQ